MSIWPGDWGKVLLPNQPLAESIVRISVVYLFLFFLLRVVLKRESGGMSISDVLVLVVVADAVQNGMAGTYTSVGDALVLAATLVFWDWFLSWLAFHVPGFARIIRPRRLPIIRDGRILTRNARHELLTHEEIMAQLRLQGIQDLAEVKTADMEANGELSIVRKGDGGDTGGRRAKRATG